MPVQEIVMAEAKKIGVVGATFLVAGNMMGSGVFLLPSSLLPVPGPVLHLLLGDGARVVLDGQQVRSERLEPLGFRFSHPDLIEALASATKTSRR